MLAILSIIIGLVFVLLLISMLSSTVLELIDAVFSLRGRHLRNTLENMLGNESGNFFGHPIFQQLSYAASNKYKASLNRLPGWINKETFSSIVMDIMNVKDFNDLENTINAMPDGETKKLLLFLLKQSEGKVENFRVKMEKWFDEIMQRATEWYKSNTKKWLFAIGVSIAAFLNADTIQIYKSLSQNTAAREMLELEAGKFVAQNDSVATLNFGNNDVTLKKAQVDSLYSTYNNLVKSPLGLGWTDQQGGGGLPYWLIKIVGLILTGLAVTLGAPFWFEVLKKLISIRNAAPASQPAPSGDKKT